MTKYSEKKEIINNTIKNNDVENIYDLLEDNWNYCYNCETFFPDDEFNNELKCCNDCISEVRENMETDKKHNQYLKMRGDE